MTPELLGTLVGGGLVVYVWVAGLVTRHTWPDECQAGVAAPATTTAAVRPSCASLAANQAAAHVIGWLWPIVAVLFVPYLALKWSFYKPLEAVYRVGRGEG